MVSGVTAPPKYKSNKRFFGSSSSQHTTPPPSPGHQHNPNSIGHKQYHPDNGMRPWPPTYKSDGSVGAGGRQSSENFRSLSTSAKFFHNNTASGNGHSNGAKNNYKNTIYEAKKFNFHSTSSQRSKGDPDNGSPTSFNLSGTNGSYANNKDYYLMPPPYENSKLAGQNGTVFYDQDNNLLLKAKDREKSRFRKLRYPRRTFAIYRNRSGL